MEDLTHLQRHIDKCKIDTSEHRRQAQNYRNRAAADRNAGQDSQADMLIQQANNEDRNAEGKENEATELESKKAQQQVEITELQRQLEDLKNDFNSRSKALEQEIKSKAGTSFSL